MARRVLLELNESERQVVLLAFAHLAVDRPGWEPMLRVLALQIDAQMDGQPMLFGEFRQMKIAERESGK